MGSQCNPGKFRYDLTMSKRTRKPLNCEQESDQSSLSSCLSEKENLQNAGGEEAEDENCDHRSLKQLIKGRHTLGQHFTEELKQPKIVVKQNENGLQEKQLQIVVKSPGGSNRVKLKKMATQCTKILRRLMRNKRGSHSGSTKIMAIQ
ncbi:hypothetical protein DCAR_0934087 [Daucus carota subsp. sativus]|uniref:Uncharacterized protein n=1 Tax=Daucus carota subsp. sativus TaxID=79200 RepID=A0A175YFL3_DAUCS|nr:PREDICTED: uncharacterized protein LOC108202282 [Daucus carota subsp. sativus]WOH14567.1 hypothetical protein DCAR_0934087 [Daucus carota subsp. sativus]